MLFATPIVIIGLLIRLACVSVFVYLVYLLIRALRKYIRSEPMRREKRQMAGTLGESLKEHRVRRQMTQEFVAESLGVSRQAVSKWESGASSLSTANLLALAKLYGVSAEELIRQCDQPQG